MADLNIAIKIAAHDNASGPLGRIKSALGGVGSAAGTVAKIAGGVLLTGLGATVGAMGAGAVAGLGFNNSMEQVSAQLNAFTKDGEKTAQILDMIRDRAARTPFEFEQMATATAALYPVATQSGVALEDLVSQAEILAASNPAQGLEGAAFALKEAVSGDFTSIIERFNLPRQYLNQLKEEGVPAAQAVSMAMQQLGLDSSLVSNLAETAQGRWSTLKDTFVGLSATVTQPIFNTFSSSLGQLNGYLADNAPLLTAMAEGLAGKVQSGIDWVVNTGIPNLQAGYGWISGTAIPTLQSWGDAIGNFVTPKLNDLQVISDNFTTTVLPPLQLAWDTLRSTWSTEVSPALGELRDALNELFVELGIGTGDTDLWQVALFALKLILAEVVLGVKLLTPAIRLVGAEIKFAVDLVRGFVEGLTSLKRGADTVIGSLRAVAERIRDLINTAASMPSWLVPGSPTPFELGLRGIANAANNLPDLGAALVPPTLARGGNLALAPAANGGAGVTFGPGSIVINAPGGEPGAVRDATQDGLMAAFRSVGLR